MAQEMLAGPGPAGAKSAIAPALEDARVLVKIANDGPVTVILQD